MTTLVIRHELDGTGTNPDNLVSGEPHSLPNRRFRVIAPQYGAYYAESLRILDLSTNQYLREDQYYPGELMELPSIRYGKPIFAVIVIHDQTVSNNIVIDYQALGGPYFASYDAIIQQINTLMLDNRPIDWHGIPNRPDEFPPTAHLHDIGDLYGFEYLVHAIDRLRDAILMGDQASHNEIFAYIDEMLRRHLMDYNNPHRTTADQVGAFTKEETIEMIAKLQRPAYRLFLAGSM